jgi:hypothetical protein
MSQVTGRLWEIRSIAAQPASCASAANEDRGPNQKSEYTFRTWDARHKWRSALNIVIVIHSVSGKTPPPAAIR